MSTLAIASLAPRRGGALAFLLASSTATLPAAASGISLPAPGSEALGMAGAVVAKPDVSSAAYHNPAIVGSTEGFRAYAGVMTAIPRVEVESTHTGATDVSTFRAIPIPHLFTSWMGKSFGASLYAGVPVGFAAGFDPAWRGRYELVKSFAFGAAASANAVIRLGPRAAVALGPYVAKAVLQVARDVDLATADAEAKLAMISGFSWGATASVFASPTPWLHLGAAYRSGTRVHFDGQADFDEVPENFQRVLNDQNVRTSVPFPHSLSMGANVEVGDRLGLGVAIEYATWSDLDELRFRFDDPHLDVAVPLELRDAVTTSLGAEFRLPPRTTLRAGLLYDQAVLPAETLTPAFPDATKLGASVGIGRQVGDFRLDGAYALYLGLAREARPPALEGRYRQHAHYIGVSLAYRPSVAKSHE